MNWRTCGALLSAAVLLPLGAAAGSAIDASIIYHAGSTPQQGRARARLDGARIRIDVPRPAGRPDAVLYLPGQNLLRHLDVGSKRYMEFDTRLLGSAGEAARSLREFLDDALSGFKRQPDTPRNALDIRAVDQVETVSGLRCRKFVVTKGGVKIQEIWATSWRNVDLDRSQVASLKQLVLYYENLATALAGIPFFDDMQRIPLGALVRIDAYPVLVRQYSGKRLIFAIRLDAPRQETVPASVFSVPAAYKKQRPWQQGQ